MTDKTGGPAFPRPASEAHQHGMHQPQDGMTLRDYFAAKAMQTMLQGSGTFESHAEYAYKMADYMLKARSA